MKKVFRKKILMKKIKNKKTNKNLFFNFFFLYIKMLAKYQQNKEKPSKKACEGYQNLSEEEKDKKH